jgi:hypothetical protein
MYVVYENQKLNSVGNQVKQIQIALPSWTSDKFLEVDGIFGSETASCVRAFQEEMGLYPDGIVGKDTGKALGVWANIEEGFDASHHNTILWDAIPINIKFAYLKATEGATYADSTFRKNASLAKSVGLDVGAYHFTKFANSPYLEASNFLNETFGIDLSYLFLDLEYRQSGLNASAIFEWVTEFCKTISGVHPNTEIGIYTSKNYLKEIKLQSYTELNEYHLWAADWKEQPFVYPWEQWHSWQYTSTANVDWAEGNLDLNLRIV